jgi:lysozyme family protein
MKINFEKSLKMVLVHEGGYVNHPRDPGGATNRGVTQATYNRYRNSRGKVAQSVRAISEAEVREIYKLRYWDAVKADQLPSGVDYAAFDFAVNSGPSRAAKYLQRACGVDDDGIIGDMTIKAAGRSNPVIVVSKMCDARLAWLKTLPTWGTFGKGWDRRVKGVKVAAMEMATDKPMVETKPEVKPDVLPRTDEDSPALLPEEKGWWATLLGLIAQLFRR